MLSLCICLSLSQAGIVGLKTARRSIMETMLDPDFLVNGEISAIWKRFQLIFHRTTNTFCGKISASQQLHNNQIVPIIRDILSIFYCACTKQAYFRFRFEDVFSWFFWSEKQKVRHIPVYLAYWPRKRATCWATHVDHFHRVWSWSDYPSPSYSVVCVDTLRDLVTLTFGLLTLDNGQTWQVTWATPPPSLNILRLSVLDLWVMMSVIGHR